MVSVVITTIEGESFGCVQHLLKALQPLAKAAITSGRRRNAGNVWNVSMETPHLSLVSTDVLRVKVELMWSPSAGCNRRQLQDARPLTLFHLLWPTHLPRIPPPRTRMSHAEMCSPKTAAFTKEGSDRDKMRTGPPAPAPWRLQRTAFVPIIMMTHTSWNNDPPPTSPILWDRAGRISAPP